MTIDAAKDQVTVRYDDHGQPKVASKHLHLPLDLANGIVQTILLVPPSLGPNRPSEGGKPDTTFDTESRTAK